MFLVVDGSFMLHRARFVAERQKILCWDYIVYLFMRSLIVSAEETSFPFSSIYVLWDKGISTHRSKILPNYKAHRIRDPDDSGYKEYKKARGFLHENLPLLGVISVLYEGIEADDFAYLISSKNEVGVHVSDDRDWFLNIFPKWILFRPRANETITYNRLCELTLEKVWPRVTYLISKSMVGDRSDNVPGINGIGWGYAKKFAPLIVNKKSLGLGIKAQLVEENMSLVRRNMALMDPSWVVNSHEASDELKQSEEKVSKLDNHLKRWKEFHDKLPEKKTYKFCSWWYRYNSLAIKLKSRG